MRERCPFSFTGIPDHPLYVLTIAVTRQGILESGLRQGWVRLYSRASTRQSRRCAHAIRVQQDLGLGQQLPILPYTASPTIFLNGPHNNHAHTSFKFSTIVHGLGSRVSAASPPYGFFTACSPTSLSCQSRIPRQISIVHRMLCQRCPV